MSSKPAKPKSPKATWRNRIVGHADVDPAKLVKHPANWRIHPAEQTKALNAVLDEVGWVQNVIVSKHTSRIVDGHARVAAAIARGEKSVPVVLVELTEAEEKKILAVLDPTAAMAGMDEQKLRELLADIDFQAEGAKALLENLGDLADEQVRQNPENVTFQEYKEDAADGVEQIACPKCGHQFPR